MMENARLLLEITYSTHVYFKPFLQVAWFHLDGHKVWPQEVSIALSLAPRDQKLYL